MSVVALVPARGGSQGIPGKNIRPFCGKPLIAWCLEALEDAQLVDRVVVATDDEAIANTVLGLDLTRPEIYWRRPENATHEASTESLMLEFIEAQASLAASDVLLLVQATSPFTLPSDFDAALSHYARSDADSLLSCVRIKRFLWSDSGQPFNYDYHHRPRRQDFAGSWLENGAFYVNTIAHVQEHSNRLSGRILFHEMPPWTALELDDEDDWALGESLLRRHHPSWASSPDGTPPSF